MSCRHAKKEIQALSGACWRILATEKGTSPWLSSPAIYAPSSSCSQPSTGTKRSGASLIGETAPSDLWRRFRIISQPSREPQQEPWRAMAALGHGRVKSLLGCRLARS